MTTRCRSGLGAKRGRDRAVRAHSTRIGVIDDHTCASPQHFAQQQMIETCFAAGLSKLINRFYPTSSPRSTSVPGKQWPELPLTYREPPAAG